MVLHVLQNYGMVVKCSCIDLSVVTFALLLFLGDGGLVELFSWTVQFDRRFQHKSQHWSVPLRQHAFNALGGRVGEE